jgi:hypothetical protein
LIWCDYLFFSFLLSSRSDSNGGQSNCGRAFGEQRDSGVYRRILSKIDQRLVQRW